MGTSEVRTAPEEVLGPIKGQEGAISMVVEPAISAGDSTFQVTCGSFEQPYCKVDDTDVIAMDQTTAPSGSNAGEWQCTMGPLAAGPHDINCFNGTCEVSVDVFAGEIPVWDPYAVLINTPAGRREKIRRDSAAIFNTRALLG